MNVTLNYTKIVEKFKQASKDAKSEEDIRLAMNIFLHDITRLYGIELDHSSEVTSIQGGRADSIYSNIIFEFKLPRKFNTQKGVDEAIHGRDEKDRGLYHYLVNFTIEEMASTANDNDFLEILLGKVGIGFDGSKFVVFRYVKSTEEINLNHKNKTLKYPKHISSKQNLAVSIDVIEDFDLGIKKILLFLRSTNRKRLSAKNLLKSFSSGAKVSKESIPYLYTLLSNNITTNTRIKTLFDEWNRIFGDIYGKDETDFTKYQAELLEMYNLPENVNIRYALFTLQTYYSIVIKLLIHNLLESLSDPTSPAKQPRYKHELTSLFSGNHYTNYNIDNFFEIHFFEWFILAEDLNIDFINSIIAELDTYETTASVIKPEVVGDVLKKMYADLIPRGLRHLLGEYYTPDWLVDFTIQKSQYDIGLNTSILDPTCGSGAFITHCIKYYTEQYKQDLSVDDLVKNITNNIVGFDINPIAVISAKANYILSLGDITQLKSNVSIPIYMCDSILVPTVHAKQKEDKHLISIDTVVGTFDIPVFNTREENDYFLKTASSCILKDYTSFAEFNDLINAEGIIKMNTSQIPVAEIFYDKLYTLHLSGRNGFWPIILKNSFAPLFSQSKFDVIIGNPPRITWKAMSDTYRKATLDIWLSYGIFEKSAYDKITSHDDFAMAVTYVAIDHYLKAGGVTCFVLPQTFVKSSKGGEGFRKFAITRDGLDIPFSIISVYDMVGINPFKGEASNKCSVYVFEKDKKMEYPMNNYFECYNLDTKNSVQYDDHIQEALEKIGYRQLSATPINDDIRSPRSTTEKKNQNKFGQYLGNSEYKGRKGIEPCGAKGIYLLKINKKVGDLIEIENLIERSRLDKAKMLGVKKGLVEKDFIYPMIGGRNIDKRGINSYLYMVVPHENSGKGIYRGYDEGSLKSHYSKTYSWLHYFKDLLLETRIRSAKFFDQKMFPWYRLDNVGEYTFAPYKVLWREQSKKMTAVVVSTIDDPFLGEKNIVTDSKVLFVSTNNMEEAHYLCAILNSGILGQIIESYTINTQRGVDIVNNIAIPKYDAKDKRHNLLAKLGNHAHISYSKGDEQTIKKIEKEIDSIVPIIFGDKS